VRVLALGGAGAVCSEATRALVRYSDFSEIVIGEIDVEKGKGLAAEIGDQFRSQSPGPPSRSCILSKNPL
jgi:hypothetical protein